MDQQKRKQREDKRDIKRAGNRKRRRQLDRDLQRNPEDAAHTEPDVGGYRSADLNGIDHDSTRRREDSEED